jgi:hypothetical protein
LWLLRAPGGQGVAGSNPVSPTREVLGDDDRVICQDFVRFRVRRPTQHHRADSEYGWSRWCVTRYQMPAQRLPGGCDRGEREGRVQHARARAACRRARVGPTRPHPDITGSGRQRQTRTTTCQPLGRAWWGGQPSRNGPGRCDRSTCTSNVSPARHSTESCRPERFGDVGRTTGAFASGPTDEGRCAESARWPSSIPSPAKYI